MQDHALPPGLRGHDPGRHRPRRRSELIGTAVVTGGGTGIGAACAARLLADGWTVVLVGRRADVLAATADRLGEVAGRDAVHHHAADLTDPDAVGALAARLGAEFGAAHAVVNNAGSPARADGDGLRAVADVWLRTYAANVVSAVLVTTALEPLLVAPGGRVVLVGSLAARAGNATPAYGAAKAALEGYLHTLAARLGPRGITANLIAPGFTEDTELTIGRISPERRERLVSTIALGRPGKPDEIAAAVAFLCRAEAGYVTDQVLGVDGGYAPWRGGG